MKFVITLIVGFVIGFYVNALLMYSPPDFLLQASTKASDIAVPLTKNNTDTNGVFVEFDGKKLIPSSIRAQVGQRIGITNMSSTQQMHLLSETENLNSIRPYAESERLYAVLMKAGTYTVRVDNVPAATLSIEVYDVPSVAK